jgi:hypothetical protein
VKTTTRGGKGTLMRISISTAYKSVWNVLKKLKLELPYNPAHYF